MRRSNHVAAPLLAAAALALNTGCQKPQMQRCVDEQNRVVDDSLCNNPTATHEMRPDGHGGFFPFFPYRFYYGGLGGYALGSMVNGGSYTPDSSHSYATRSGTITRGGFGSSFSEGGAHSSSGSSSGS